VSKYYRAAARVPHTAEFPLDPSCLKPHAVSRPKALSLSPEFMPKAPLVMLASEPPVFANKHAFSAVSTVLPRNLNSGVKSLSDGAGPAPRSLTFEVESSAFPNSLSLAACFVLAVAFLDQFASSLYEAIASASLIFAALHAGSVFSQGISTAVLSISVEYLDAIAAHSLFQAAHHSFVTHALVVAVEASNTAGSGLPALMVDWQAFLPLSCGNLPFSGPALTPILKAD